MLAKHSGVPSGIADKPSSEDLLAHLPNPVLFGLSHEQLDAALVGFERGMRDRDIAAKAGAPVDACDAFGSAITIQGIKRSLPRHL